MTRKMLMWMMLLLVAPGLAAAGQPKDAAPDGKISRAGYLSVGLGGAYMWDPDMPAALVSIDYYVTDEISVGPHFQVGGAGSNNYWGVAGQVKYTPALANNQKVRPYVMMGIGFADLRFEEIEEDGITYLFPIGGGMEFEVADILSIDFGGIFNITEDSFTGLTVGCRILL